MRSRERDAANINVYLGVRSFCGVLFLLLLALSAGFILPFSAVAEPSTLSLQGLGQWLSQEYPLLSEEERSGVAQAVENGLGIQDPRPLTVEERQTLLNYVPNFMSFHLGRHTETPYDVPMFEEYLRIAVAEYAARPALSEEDRRLVQEQSDRIIAEAWRNLDAIGESSTWSPYAPLVRQYAVTAEERLRTAIASPLMPVFKKPIAEEKEREILKWLAADRDELPEEYKERGQDPAKVTQEELESMVKTLGAQMFETIGTEFAPETPDTERLGEISATRSEYIGKREREKSNEREEEYQRRVTAHSNALILSSILVGADDARKQSETRNAADSPDSAAASVTTARAEASDGEASNDRGSSTDSVAIEDRTKAAAGDSTEEGKRGLKGLLLFVLAVVVCVLGVIFWLRRGQGTKGASIKAER